MSKKRIGLCIYCEEEKEVTREHIPSRGLFNSGAGVEFRFVESCRDCNIGFSKDEEFLRNWLANAHYEASEEATSLFDGAITRSYKQKPSLAQHFFNQMQLVTLIDPVTKKPITMTRIKTTPVDKKKIIRIVEKYVRGLATWHFGSRLEKDLEITIIQVDQKWIEANKDVLEKAPLNVIKKDVFEYKYAQVPDTQQSMWALSFFDATYFVGFIHKKS